MALKIGLERQCYVAGQQIRGVLEVHSKTKGLALGDIGIEFGGTEGQSCLLHGFKKHVRCSVWPRQVTRDSLSLVTGGSRRCLEPSVNIDADGPVRHRNQLLECAGDQADY